MRRTRLSLAFLLVPLLLSAQAGPGQEALERATDAFFDQSLQAVELRRLLEAGREAFAGLADPCLRDYWLARVEYLSGFVERGDRREKEAQRRFQAGLALAERAASCPGLADAPRLQADLIAQLIPASAKARLTLALYFLNAPAIAGGSDAEALRILHELEGREGLERPDRFGVLTWLGLAYQGRKDPERARLFFRRAQEVYPGNTWVRELAASL
jgi:tetratricopeptide (TPR) repeat protein